MSDSGHRCADNVPALLAYSPHATRPESQVPTHPATRAALHVAGRSGAAGPLHPAPLHGERGGADLHSAGSLRQEVLPGAGLLDGAAHDHAGPAQDGEEHRAGAPFQ